MKIKIESIRLYVLTVFSALTVISCKKNTAPPAILASSNAFIKEAVIADTLAGAVSPDLDSIVTFKLEASVTNPVSGTHTVVFGVDTGQMANYIAKYGTASLLPSSNYFIPFPDGNFTEEAKLSSAAQINIVNTSKLSPGTTYVLPVVMKSIDGQPIEKPLTDQAIYLVVRVSGILSQGGTPINKAGWTIVSYSSQDDADGYPAINVLDNDVNTQWLSDQTQQLPQWLVIDMGQPHSLKAITFQYDPAFSLDGGAPTQVEIELSNDGTVWSNAGTFSGLNPGTQTQSLYLKSITAARYIRFTVLQATVLYAGYSYAFVSEIGAND
jgi:hypothetical protein